MKEKPVVKSVRNGSGPVNGSVLRQLHEQLQNYLEAIKSVGNNREYHHLIR
jgi:hypothetical protein